VELDAWYETRRHDLVTGVRFSGIAALSGGTAGHSALCGVSSGKANTSVPLGAPCFGRNVEETSQKKKYAPQICC